MRGMKLGLQIVLSLLLCLAFAGAAFAAPADSGQIPEKTEKYLRRAIQDYIKDVYDKKDDQGRHFQKARSTFDFQPAADGRYQVGLYKEIVEDDERSMRSERYVVTLAQEDEEKWKIVDEKLVDTITGMVRRMPGDEQFYLFDKFAFDAEGLGVSSGPGSLVVYTRKDNKTGMRLMGDGLSYDYEPPAEVRLTGRYNVIKELKEKDFVFTPEWVNLRCSHDRCERFLEELFTNLRKADASQISAELEKEVEKDDRELAQSRKENNLGGFRFEDEPDNDYYWVTVKKKGKDHYLGISYDDWEPKEVRLVVSGYWPALLAYYSKQTRESGASVYELERRPDQDARFFDITSLKGVVELGTEEPEKMTGDLTYRLLAHQDLDYVSFGIAVLERPGNESKTATRPRLTVDYIKDDQGNDLSWIQLGPNYGRVIFPEKKKRGEQFTIHMKFANAKAIFDFSWSYKGMARGGWLPFVRFGDMIDEFEMTVKVPEGFTTLGIGTKVAERVEGGENITEWESEHPVTFPTIIFGKYINAKSSVQAKKLDGTPIPVTIYVDKNALSEGSARSGQWGIRPKQLQPLVDQAAQAINLYEHLYGVDYPFSKLDLVNDPVGGALYGQAPSSIIYLGSLVFRGAGTLASNMERANSSMISKFNKSVVAHETGHQWWGASTSNANSGNYWFIESLAEYSSAIYTERAYGHAEYLKQVEAWKDELVDAHTVSSVQDSYTVWGGDYGPSRNIYARGPYAFHILRKTFGDEKFFRFLRMLAQSMAKKQIVTEDIKMVSEIAFGADMSWFWDQWVRGVGLPEYAYDLRSRATEDGQYLVEGTIKQRVVLGKKEDVLKNTFFRGAVPVRIVYTDGTTEDKPVLVEGELTRVRFKVAKKPKKIVFNGEGEILLEKMVKTKDF